MRRLAVLAGAAIAAACARLEPPPGARPDKAPPRCVATFPESVAVIPGFKGPVTFRFDEVVSEGQSPNFGFGNGDLERLILLSPDTAVPRVRWHRDRITVEPKHGWLPNTVYRIELAPGLRDLRQNATKDACRITFATGGPLPTRYIEGSAVDWVGRRFLPNALIEAILLPDSLRYLTTTDSTGHFRFGPLPPGAMLVRAVNDENHDNRLQLKEAWDTVPLAPGAERVGEIWTFRRDTVGAKFQSVAKADSHTVTLTLTQPVATTLSLPSDSLRVLLLPDSVTIGASRALPGVTYDSVFPPPLPTTAAKDTTRPDSAKADSAGTKPDSTKTKADTTGPKQQRTSLGMTLKIRTTGVIQPGSKYFVEARGVRTEGGYVTTVRGVLDLSSIKPDTSKARADTARVKTDSAKARADSGGGRSGGGLVRRDSARVPPRRATSR